MTLTSRRVLVGALLAVIVLMVVSSDALYGRLIGFLNTAAPVIRERPVLGGFLFVVLAAASAMLAFVSSAAVVPIGVYVWGRLLTMALLWTGWILGGICAYAIGSRLGRPMVQSLVSKNVLEKYEQAVSQRAPFGFVLLFQAALPSELPGYLLGLVRYRFWKFVAALAIVELPYALVTVYLGETFVKRQTVLLVAVGIAAAALTTWALYTLHRRFGKEQN